MKILKFFLILILVAITSCAEAQEVSKPLHLTLTKALQLVDQENAQVFAANQRVRQAIARITQARSELLPQITASGSGQRKTTDLRSSGINLPGDPHIGPFNTFDARARLTMEIFNPSAIQRLQSARAGEKLSQAEFEKVREDILAFAGALFLEAQRASQAITLNKTQLKETQHRYALTKLRLKQGTASVADLDKAKMDFAQARYVLKASWVHAEQTRLDLASALRIPLDQKIIFDEDKQWVNQELPSSSISPDVVVSQAQLDFSKAALKEARAGFFPKITASGDYGRLGESPSASSNTYALGIAVSLPIWEGGLKQAQLQSAQSKLIEDEVLLADAQNQNEAKIREAGNNLAQAKSFLKVKTEQMNYAQHQWTIANHRLHSGMGSQLDVDEANSMKAKATDEKNEAQALYWTAKINLAHSMGQVKDLFGG